MMPGLKVLIRPGDVAQFVYMSATLCITTELTSETATVIEEKL